MYVSGEEALRYDAIRLDTFAPVNRGELVSANDQTGAVYWKDPTGETKSVTLGPHAIKIMPRRR